MKPVVLSKRLQAVADMVTKGNRVCDVGCDHGFVSIYLVEQGISSSVLAMDVRSGPLGAAMEHVTERKLQGVIQTRLSDGLHKYNIGEADTLICAGMGGKLMMRILSAEKEKTDSFRELVLQPQSELEEFRRFLFQSGYAIVQENMIEEDGKFYPIMRVVKAQGMEKEPGVLAFRYGPVLLETKSPVLWAYLQKEERVYQEILKQLMERGLEEPGRKQRYQEVSQMLEECQTARNMIQSNRI